jgi:hypothetical protein
MEDTRFLFASVMPRWRATTVAFAAGPASSTSLDIPQRVS